MQPPISRRSLLNYAGIAILIVGMCLGEFIYWRGLHNASAADDTDPLADQYQSRVYQREIAVNVGTFGVIMDGWVRSLANLREPGPLAATIVIFTMLTAGGCFIIASRFPRD